MLRSQCPPPLEDFETMIRSAALIESLRAIFGEVLVNASRDPAWIPHFELIDAFMREHGIPVALCTVCGGVSYNGTLINQTCGRIVGGTRCTGVNGTAQ
jgi:hypothetical protein